MVDITISLSEARRLALFAQGFYTDQKIPAIKSNIKQLISKLGIIQIDTINIVARAPYLSVWSRLGDYDPAWIDELLYEKQIFEYWAHASSLLPIEDYPIHRRFMLNRLRLPGYDRWYESNKTQADRVLDHVRQNGAVRSSDFKRTDGIKGTWWNWKFEKEALEYWFVVGELMVAKRINFQRVYDLKERVLKSINDNEIPDLATVVESFILKTVSVLGVARDSWIRDYYRVSNSLASTALKKLVSTGSLMRIQVGDWKEPVWVVPEIWDSFNQSGTRTEPPKRTTFLSPFDSLIWDRSRTQQLFNFDYRIECYTPAAKRQYGYFCLPILSNGELVGRLDAKAHREAKQFEIKALYLEKGVKPALRLAKQIAETVIDFANWHKTPLVVIQKSEPQEFKSMIERYL